ncbi:MAG: hypothetical protein ACKVHO_17910 [Verrucomicrobiia bacterium]|jgi:hypothetical protein
MNKSERETGLKGEKLIASFGDARLLKSDAGVRMQGGSMADRMEAMEWVSMFMAEVRLMVDTEE